MASAPGAATITRHEEHQIERANATGFQAVVLVHGLWLLPNSWERWAEFFEAAGFVALAPGWPDDPATVEAANRDPEVLAKRSIGQIANYTEAIVRRLRMKPALIGHS